MLMVLHALGGTAVRAEGSEFEERELHGAERLGVRPQILNLVRECVKSARTYWCVMMAWLEVKHLVGFLQVKLRWKIIRQKFACW